MPTNDLFPVDAHASEHRLYPLVQLLLRIRHDRHYPENILYRVGILPFKKRVRLLLELAIFINEHPGLIFTHGLYQ